MKESIIYVIDSEVFLTFINNEDDKKKDESVFVLKKEKYRRRVRDYYIDKQCEITHAKDLSLACSSSLNTPYFPAM